MQLFESIFFAHVELLLARSDRFWRGHFGGKPTATQTAHNHNGKLFPFSQLMVLPFWLNAITVNVRNPHNGRACAPYAHSHTPATHLEQWSFTFHCAILTRFAFFRRCVRVCARGQFEINFYAAARNRNYWSASFLSAALSFCHQITIGHRRCAGDTATNKPGWR